MIELVYMTHRSPGMTQEQLVDHHRHQHGPPRASILEAALYVGG